MLTNRETLKLLIEQNRYVPKTAGPAAGALERLSSHRRDIQGNYTFKVMNCGFLFGLGPHADRERAPLASTPKCHFASLGKQTFTPSLLPSPSLRCLQLRAGVQGIVTCAGPELAGRTAPLALQIFTGTEPRHLQRSQISPDGVSCRSEMYF